MSYFGIALDEMLKRKSMKATELSRLSGVGEPMISRYRKGDTSFVSTDDLTRIAGSISQNVSEQAELVRAHLQDECPETLWHLISVDLRSGELKDRVAPYREPLGDELEHHFDIIRKWIIKDSDVREIIVRLSNVLESKK